MKNVLYKSIFIVIITLSCYQCSDDEDIFTASANQEAMLLEVDVPNELVLDPQFASNTILNFAWQSADYGQATQINYRLEMDDTPDFSEPVSVSSSTQRSIALTVSQLNDAVGKAGLAPFETGTIYTRIRSSIGTENNLEQFSNTVSFDIFPYTTIQPQLFVVGAFQADSGYGTTNAEAPKLASSEFGSETDYEGFVYFDSDAEFQLHRAGFSGEYVEGNLIYGNNAGVISAGATGAFNISAGYYLINVDLDKGTITFSETNWAIAGPGGPAGDWPGDTVADADMTYNIQERVWEFTNASASPGKFKFRANDDWALNFGTDNNGDGSLDFNGPDLINGVMDASVFRLNLNTPRAYTFSISQ